MQGMLGVNGTDTDSTTLFVTKEFYKAYKSFNDSLLVKYKSTSAIEKDIKKGLQHVKYYFPDYKIPGFITYLSTLDGPGIALTSAGSTGAAAGGMGIADAGLCTGAGANPGLGTPIAKACATSPSRWSTSTS